MKTIAILLAVCATLSASAADKDPILETPPIIFGGRGEPSEGPPKGREYYDPISDFVGCLTNAELVLYVNFGGQSTNGTVPWGVFPAPSYQCNGGACPAVLSGSGVPNTAYAWGGTAICLGVGPSYTNMAFPYLQAYEVSGNIKRQIVGKVTYWWNGDTNYCPCNGATEESSNIQWPANLTSTVCIDAYAGSVCGIPLINMFYTNSAGQIIREEQMGGVTSPHIRTLRYTDDDGSFITERHTDDGTTDSVRMTIEGPPGGVKGIEPKFAPGEAPPNSQL